MPSIVLFTVAVVAALVVLVLLRDARDARRPRTSEPAPPATAPGQAVPFVPSAPSVDVEALAAHVRELRRAVDQGLIGRDEAIDSIVRQADGSVGEGAAERLLDGADPR